MAVDAKMVGITWYCVHGSGRLRSAARGSLAYVLVRGGEYPPALSLQCACTDETDRDHLLLVRIFYLFLTLNPYSEHERSSESCLS